MKRGKYKITLRSPAIIRDDATGYFRYKGVEITAQVMLDMGQQIIVALGQQGSNSRQGSNLRNKLIFRKTKKK